ncbi:MAG: YbgF trimerization domain-containing protein, partial [Gammaproteobacteria bacterium]
MKTKALVGICMLAGVVLLGGCATQVTPDDPVYQRIAGLQHQVDQLQKLVKGQGMMDVVSSQQQMQQELATLQGQIQDLQHQYQQSRLREQSVDQEFDRRLAAIEQGASAVGIRVGGSNPAAGAAS